MFAAATSTVNPASASYCKNLDGVQVGFQPESEKRFPDSAKKNGMPREQVEALKDTDQRESPSATHDCFTADNDRMQSGAREMMEGDPDLFRKATTHPNYVAASNAYCAVRLQGSRQDMPSVCVINIAKEALRLLPGKSVRFVLPADTAECEDGEASEQSSASDDRCKLSMTEILNKQREEEVEVDAAYRDTVRAYYGIL
ncbi:MAG: hypothetical protein Q9225_004647 [Loekoesia sp. 1 TL-2023]